MSTSLAPRALSRLVACSSRMHRKSAEVLVFISLVAVLVVPGSALAAVSIYIDQASWQAAITAINAPAAFSLENFNGEALSPGTGLSTGPHVYGGGDFSVAMNGVGNGGSHTGIVGSGESRARGAAPRVG